MAKKKTSGVRKLGDRNYAIDKIILVNGKRIHVYQSGFASAKEANEAMPGIVEARRREVNPLTCSKTFDHLYKEYLDYRSTVAKSQTISGLSYMIEKHILPTFTGLPISEALTFDRVRSWYKGEVSSTRYSAMRKNKVFSEMRQIIDRAWHWHYITSETHQDLEDVVQNIKLPNRAKSTTAVWTYADELRFLNSIPKDSIDYPMFTLFCYLGCRIGEFQGLQWKCFNERQGTITITQQVVVEKGAPKLTAELKTNESYRVNQLDQSTYDLLVKYRRTLNSSSDDEFIFPSPFDSRNPFSRSAFRRRFNRYIELSGAPKIVLHGVRHSKATMLASVCRNAEEVAVGAKFLGHSSSMFMGTYVDNQSLDQQTLISRLTDKHSA